MWMKVSQQWAVARSANCCQNHTVFGRLLRYGLFFLAFVAGLTVASGCYGSYQLRASLPILTGSQPISGLTAPVIVTRDSLGVPTIAGATREDVARGLGFLHAQDRFFQMDLQRRQPAGELAALVGPRAFDVDQQARTHRMRTVAQRALALADPRYRGLLDAYTAGVNAGLAALAAPPFEYLVLRSTPEPWQPEDSILTVLAMFNTLQGRQGLFEQSMEELHETLPEPMFQYLTTVGSEWDTPVVGNPVPRPPIPTTEQFDLRKTHSETRNHRNTEPLLECKNQDVFSVSVIPCFRDEYYSTIGSNNWAVDGAHSSSGSALIANDMHLSIGVPIIWYRASMVIADPTQPQSPAHITGVTLPGLPSMVVGSNGQVAWGFTNTGGDWSDLVRIERDPRDPSKYLTPGGPKAFEDFTERIAARGAEPRVITVRWTDWGPIVWKDPKGREYAQHWLAHDPALLASDTSRPERAYNVSDLLEGIAGLGIPNQNVVMGDTSGRIAWTIGGAIPRRVGFDGFLPTSWADGTRKWDGYLPSADFPRIENPPTGRVWTANAPVVDGAMLATIGDGGYADGIRARIIRDQLLSIDKATPKDMLNIQLNDRALYLERWRTLALDMLGKDPKPTAARTEYKRLIDTTWTGRASTGSVAYRLVRTFRMTMVRQVMLSLTAPAKAIDPAFDYTRTFRGEGPVWPILMARPMNLLDPQFKSWDEAIFAAIDQSINELTADGRALSGRTWGEANTAEIFHPLAAGIPMMGPYLNMPSDPLAGDIYTPRASQPRVGPSERMVVSPGHESEGILHIPTGQSGHPMSPHYGDEFRAWLNGEATPFMPGPAVSTLTLIPR
jgi:penicillin amidase